MRELLSIAIIASVKAGEAIMKVYSNKIDVVYKEDESPLTLADKNANKIINKYLVKSKIPIISEENKILTYEERKNWKQCWIVDPLDGTKEFIKRNGEFTVNIALIKNNKPIIGVIYVPVSKTLYFTSDNSSKSYKALLKTNTIIIDEIFNNAVQIFPTQKNNNILRIVGSRSHLNDTTKNYISKIEKKNKTRIVSKGSSLKFCLVAEGEAEIYPRFAPTMEWDTAAGQAICEAVGVKVTDVTTNEPLKYNKQNLLNPHFLVTN
ncbi:MAG: 3'(2'),5'-bisphosphate nucleotidase CysQ [Flavobacteriaceae bacterium]|nr:3'(2'),5'-bisphosphate nucleotidase CysQ [Flavobacteriaceae bacterium]|tara:strand:+ start:501 stop:1292 length:792 start_codon:yes stop_codon:yes gene_type:complete